MVDSLLNSPVPAEPGPRSVVMREIIRNIEEGNYAVGQPLPSTRKLSETLNVHRGTITRAFSLLEDEGYLKTGANGMRIVASKSNQASEFVAHSIAMLIMPPESWRESSRESGWLEYIDRGMFEQIRAEKLHAMWLHADLVNEAMVFDLIRNSPQGVVVGEHAARLPWMVSLLERLHKGGLPVIVNVHDVTLPDSTTIRTAFTLDPRYVKTTYGDAYDDAMMMQHYELMADHRINPDNIYRRDLPDVDVLKHFDERDRFPAT